MAGLAARTDLDWARRLVLGLGPEVTVVRAEESCAYAVRAGVRAAGATRLPGLEREDQPVRSEKRFSDAEDWLCKVRLRKIRGER